MTKKLLIILLIVFISWGALGIFWWQANREIEEQSLEIQSLPKIPCNQHSDCENLICLNVLGKQPPPLPSCISNFCKCGWEYCERIGGCE